jgi:hypothetical protein
MAFSAQSLPLSHKRAVQKTRPLSSTQTFQESKTQHFSGYGALPHRPTKGLSGRPLETFGQKFLVFLEMSVLLA